MAAQIAADIQAGIIASHPQGVELTIASGVITVSKSFHLVRPESGTTDDLVVIKGLDGPGAHLYLGTAEGSTITLNGFGSLTITGTRFVHLIRHPYGGWALVQGA